MEPEGSMPYSQELSTGPYPEPYQSISLRSNLMSIFFRLGRLSKESVHVQGFLFTFVTDLFFTVSSC
jgi:hypothetical protein